MAKQILTNLDLLALPSLTNPKTGSVGFGAKSDGLYQKIGSAESKLTTQSDIDTAIANTGVASHIENKANPHNVTKAQVGLSRVDNESKVQMFSYATLTGETTITEAYITYSEIGQLYILNEMNVGNWKFKQVGTELHFLFNNVVKQKFLSDGTIVAEGGLTALGTPPHDGLTINLNTGTKLLFVAGNVGSQVSLSSLPEMYATTLVGGKNLLDYPVGVFELGGGTMQGKNVGFEVDVYIIEGSYWVHKQRVTLANELVLTFNN